MINRRQFLTGIAASAAAASLAQADTDGVALKSIEHPPLATRTADVITPHDWITDKPATMYYDFKRMVGRRLVSMQSIEDGRYDDWLNFKLLSRPYGSDMVLIEYDLQLNRELLEEIEIDVI